MTRFTLVAIAVTAFSTPAWAQVYPPVFDNFESYQVGSGIAGNGGWDAWDHDLAYDSVVTDINAFSGTKSLDIKADSDTLLLTQGMTNGCFEIEAMQFIPNNFTGQHYFLVLNTYNHGGPYDWSLQLELDSDYGALSDNTFAQSPLRPYITNQWVPIGVTVDLFRDIGRAHYDGDVLYTDVWSEHLNAGGVAAIEALDLYANGSTSVLYDNVTVKPCLDLVSVTPGEAQMPNDFVIAGAAPNERVLIAFGLSLGQTQMPGCPGAIVPLGNPRLLAFGQADANGDATIQIDIPQKAAGKTAHFIAASPDDCRVSGRYTVNFP